MRSLIIIFTFLILVPIFAQTNTYSDEEVKMIEYMQRGYWEVKKFNNLKQYLEIKDSCSTFFRKYPNSFAKPNVFTFLLQLTAIFSDDKSEISSIADSALFYDSSPSIKLTVAEILIAKSINIEKAESLLNESIPFVNGDSNKIKALLLLADVNVQQNRMEVVKQIYREALNIDSTNLKVLRRYSLLVSTTEQPSEYDRIKNKIEKVENTNFAKSYKASTQGPNIGKNISGYNASNLTGNAISLSKYKGRITVINFFGFWCSYCVEEFPVLLLFQKQHPQVNLIFMADTRYSLAEISDKFLNLKQFGFLKTNNLLISDIDKLLQINGVPHTIVVDKNGFIRYNFSGYHSEINSLLSKNIAEMSLE